MILNIVFGCVLGGEWLLKRASWVKHITDKTNSQHLGPMGLTHSSPNMYNLPNWMVKASKLY